MINETTLFISFIVDGIWKRRGEKTSSQIANENSDE